MVRNMEYLATTTELEPVTSVNSILLTVVASKSMMIVPVIEPTNIYIYNCITFSIYALFDSFSTCWMEW